ncbi:MAG TPA: amino acid racemase [Clostridia bacterium]|nr:amino acid racemase [Clostridia bacterium]HOR13360.1 amino acid racemase [Clostridia bacterium]
MKKTIGILGGMGPLATADLFKCIVLLTKAASDNEHIPILVDNNTAIPDRTSAILYGGANPRPELIKSAKRLEAMGAELIVMPCNTAHYFYDDVARTVKIPFLNMINETVSEAKRMGLTTVGLLSTSGTSKSLVYDKAFKAQGIEVIKPSDAEQVSVTAIIYEGIKASNYNIDLSAFKALLERLHKSGAQALVLGCTELPIAFDVFNLTANTLNPSKILAARAIEAAGGEVCQEA